MKTFSLPNSIVYFLPLFETLFSEPQVAPIGLPRPARPLRRRLPPLPLQVQRRLRVVLGAQQLHEVHGAEPKAVDEAKQGPFHGFQQLFRCFSVTPWDEGDRQSALASALQRGNTRVPDEGHPHEDSRIVRARERTRLHRLAVDQGSGNVREMCEAHGEECVRWRLQQCVKFGTWMGTDEMSYCIQLLRVLHPEGGYVPPLVVEDGQIMRMENAKVPSMPTSRLTVLIDSHWICMQLQELRGELHIKYRWASRTQIEIVTPLVLQWIGKSSSHVYVTSSGELSVEGMCGWQCVHYWIQDSRTSVPRISNWDRLVGEIDCMRRQLAHEAVEAFREDVDNAKPDDEVARLALDMRIRFLLHINDKPTHRKLAYGGVNKVEYGKQVANDTAILLLKQGMELSTTTLVAQALLKALGRERLESIVHGQRHVEATAQLKIAAEKHNIQWPEKVAHGGQKGHNQSKGKGKGKTKTKMGGDVKADDLMLQAGSLVNEDGTITAVLRTFGPGMAGVKLMDPAEARVWLEEPALIGKDELAIAVLGPSCPYMCGGGCTRVQLPAHTRAGSPVLVQACLHNVGEKKVTPVQAKATVEIPDSMVVSVTSHQDEVADDEWAHLLRAPVKTTLELLGTTEEMRQFLGPPWARSWQLQRKTVQPESADSFQYHARVPAAILDQLLKLSGNGGTYVVPKKQGSSPDHRYAVIWMRGTSAETAKAISNIAHFGQIRVQRRSGQMSRGVRVRREDFAQIFAKLRPNEEVPHVDPVHTLYKLKPIPHGATAEGVGQWLKTLGWEARPLKALGSGAWLVGSTNKDFKPESFVKWNDSTVLVQKVQSREERRDSTILAGKWIPPSERKESQDVDPWMTYLQMNGKQIASTPTPLKAVGAGSVRTVEAPIEDRFKQQDARIEALRTSLDQLSTSVQEGHTRQHEHQEKTTREFVKLRSEMSGQIENMTLSFQKSLHEALAKQEERADGRLESIRAMIAAQGEKTSPNPKELKRAKVDGP